VVHQTSTENALEESIHVLNRYPVEQDKYDLLTFFTNIRDKIEQHLKERCDRVKHVKWYLNVQVEFIRETHEGEVDNSQPYFRSKTYTLLSRDDASNHEINEAYQKQFQAFDEYIARRVRLDIKASAIYGSAYFTVPSDWWFKLYSSTSNITSK